MKPSGVQLTRPMVPPGRQTRTSSAAARSLVGGEHDAQGGKDGVEGGVGEGQGLGVALGEGDLQPLGRRPFPAALQQLGDVVDAGDLGAVAGRGQGGVAAAGGHVQDAVAGPQAGRLGQVLGHGHDPGGHGGVVAAGPHLLLARLDRGQVRLGGLGGGAHVLLLEHGGFRRNDPAPACERA